MIKFKLLLILFFICNFFAFSQVKESIVIINPEYNTSIIDTFNREADKYEENDQKKLSETFKAFTDAGHGSGFVVADMNGDQYIITNKHVVQFAQSLTLAIENDDNEVVEITDAEVICIDRTLDLALIKLNKNNVKSTFDLSLNNLEDGQDVWAAGYPGLLGEPAWQFSKGNITNKKANIPQMESRDLIFLIQHSASIDPGNSGGPLLIKDDNSLGFSVIGINTWSISNRNNTYFSIPSVTIMEFFDRATENYKKSNNKEDIKELLFTSIDNLVEELNSEDPNQQKISSYISPQFIGNKGYESFEMALDTGSSSLRTKWRNSFFNISPVGTMRGAIYERIMNLQDSEHDTEFIKLMSFENDPYFKAQTQFKMNNKKVKMNWVYNHGLWQIEDMQLNKLSIEKKKDLVDKESFISPAYMNFALPGLTQMQRNESSGIYYAIFGIGGVYLILDSFFHFSASGIMGDDSSFRETELSTGLTFYFSSALISFFFELLED